MGGSEGVSPEVLGWKSGTGGCAPFWEPLGGWKVGGDCMPGAGAWA